jgi:ABC-2 type transport system ATP-binding protein
MELEAGSALGGAGEPAAPLVLRDVERRWGRRPVLKGASLRLSAGSVTWLGGPNGAGKTTLLRVAAGLILPHSGSLSLCGLDPERDRRAYQRHLGYLSAGDRGLYARLTVAANLEFWAGIALVPFSRKRRMVDAAWQRFDLGELLDRRVDRLSMGQRQRVRLAMTFLHDPQVVMLDEPHTSLDDAALGLLAAALDELTGRGGSALWCSPAARQLPLRAEVRLLLEDGRVLGT